MANGNGHNGASPPVAAVVSKSELMRKRVSFALAKAGFEVASLTGVKAFLKNPRQRPFVVCFIDFRGENAQKWYSMCKEKRPGERYVIIRGAWSGAESVGDGANFGSLCEAFSEEELITWASRAVDEERKMREAPPLEELLYERFRDFLNHLGPASMKDLHQLVSERVERPLFAAVMEWSKGNQSKASEVLGIHRNTLRSKLKSLGVSGRLGRADDA